MQFILSAAVVILESYLAVTGMVAENILALTSSKETTVTDSDEGIVNPSRLRELGSSYGTIPKILIDSVPPQAAAVLSSSEAIQRIPPANDPSDAVVNIYCTYRNGDQVIATAGTGFIIDPQGIILTNAHVAHSLVLEEVRGDSDCVIRSGLTATAAYEAELLYISVAWVIEHAEELTSNQPKGTGERDFALLYIANGLNNQPVPAALPYIDATNAPLTQSAYSEEVQLIGYPAATAFAADTISADLPQMTATTDITELMTFGSNQADVFEVGGTALGEQGVSGSPVLNEKNHVIGLVSTLGKEERSLRALTISYIDRTIQEETGRTLQAYLEGDVALRSQLFKQLMVPFLQNVLSSAGVE